MLRHIDPTPAVSGPNANVRAPEPAIAHDPDVNRAGDSVVKLLGTACGLGIEGSGWVAGPGLVVTNAHVVAGEDDTTVTPALGRYARRLGGPLRPAQRSGDPARGRAGPAGAEDSRRGWSAGTAAAVLGYPENGPFTISPARVGSTGQVISEDSYGRGPVRRRMTPFRGQVQSGNSGGPVRRFQRPGADHGVRRRRLGYDERPGQGGSGCRDRDRARGPGGPISLNRPTRQPAQRGCAPPSGFAAGPPDPFGKLT